MAVNLINGLGGPAGFGENFLEGNDDESTPFIDLRTVFPNGLNFFGTVYTGLYLNNNGSVTFAFETGEYTPTSITGTTSNPMIAPYWADVDTRAGSVAPTPGGTSTGSDLVWYDLDTTNHVFTATWDDVGYFSEHTDRLNSFQLRLIQVGSNGDFNIEFRYEGVDWTTGDASDGVGGLGGVLARAGYTSGNGVNFFEMPQSGDQAALLSLESLSNVGDPGRFFFTVRSGAATPTLSIGDISAVEGNGSPANYAAVTVQLASASATPITVNYATSNGVAIAGTDYIAQAGTLTFAPGVTQQVIFVELIGDTVPELDEAFNVTLSGAVGAPIADTLGVVTIANDDGFAIGDVTLLEGTGASPTAFVFTVSLLSPSAGATSVNWATAFGSAGAADLTAASGTLNFAAGETSKTLTVNVAADSTLESSETFSVQLSGATGATIADATATGTIVNDDGLVIDNATIIEGTDAAPGSVELTIRLLTAAAAPVTVNWATSPSSAGAPGDFTTSSGSVSFAAGETTKTILVPIVRDSLVESSETFFVNLSGAAGASIVDSSATVTIVDDDGFSVSDVSVTEGTGGSRNATFTVTLSSPLAAAATVNYATQNGTATAGSDYTAASGTLTFAAGVTSQTVNVALATDATPEANETFSLVLSSPSANSGITDSTGLATVFNDDGLSISDATITEGQSGTTSVNLNVSLSAAAASAVTVNWATTDGTAGAGSDYVAASGTLTFAPGDVSETITLTVNGDTLWEPNETFRVVLSSPSNSALIDASGTVTINNDDVQPPPSLSITDVQITEGNGSGTALVRFLVNLSYPAVGPVSVNFATSPGTASAGSDYTTTTGTLTIPAGSLFGFVEIPVVRDNLVELNEVFTVTLSNATGGATISDASATATIVNDDFTTLSIAPLAASVAEGDAGNTPFTFTVTRVGDTAVAHTVNYTISGAANAADFAGGVLPSGSVTFAAGETSKVLTLNVAGDLTVETSEAFTVTLSGPTGGAILGTAQAAGSIINDDTSISISASSANKNEGQSGTTAFTFTVSRTGDTTAASSVDYAVSGVAVQSADAADFAGGIMPPAGTVTFAAGETSKTITVNVAGDTLSEVNEGFHVQISNPTNATLGTAGADGMIVNDDARAVNGTLDLITLTPGATSTFSGHGGVTTDGLGTNSTGTLQTDLPAGSTIVAAYLHVETRTFDLPFRPGQIGFGGQNVPLTFLGNVQDALPSSGINFETGFADVTSIVTSIVGAGPVGGLFNFTVDETITGNAGFVEGTSLTVIYSNASSPETTILVLHGGLTGPAINTTILNFASPLNPNAPGFNAEMALGIQYGYNGPGTANSPDIQYSMIDVNGARLTSSAGENDDSALASPFNGNLITVGGVGDNPANPTNANVHDLSLDDELYTLNGFIQNGTSALAIETVNPSDDDLIFLLTLSITGIASLSNGGSVLSILPAAAVGLEGNAGTTALTFTVVRDGDTTAAASVNYAVTGSGANPVAASDFSGVLPSGVVNFAIGETSKTITVNVSGDTVFEQDETFTVTLSGVSGALIGTGSAAGTIQNDDPEDDLLVSTPADQTLDGGDGNDTVTYSGIATPVTVSLALGGAQATGGGGLDTLISIENLIGGSAGDTLTGNAGVNSLAGGLGADTLIGAAGADALDGGGGIDTADYSSSGTRVRVNLSTGAALDADAQGDTFVSIENLRGSALNDILTGDGGANVLFGGAGNDQLSGLGGADILAGGAGIDALNGGDGVDAADYSASAARVRVNLATGAGLDADAQGDTLSNIEDLVGSAFNDILTGDAGANRLAGGAGADALDGAGGNDTADYSASTARVRVSLATGVALDAHAQGDTFANIENLIGSAFNDVLIGTAGVNVLSGGAGADTLDGGGDIDTADYSASAARVRVNLATGAGLDGDAQHDVLSNIENLIGSAFDDILTGSTIANALSGAAGADTLVGGLGADALNGGDGSDTADYSASAARVRISLATGVSLDADAQGDTFVSVENLTGTAFNDVLTGSDLANTLSGGAGNDQMSGLGANDVLIGGAGADAMNGGDGTDTADYSASATRVRVNLATGAGLDADASGDVLSNIENLTGSAFNDILTGTSGVNVLTGGAGADTLAGGASADTLNGGDGVDVADYSASASRVRVNLATGAALDADAQGDTLSSIESVIGSAFDDILTGNTLANALTGGAGADTLIGGLGADALNGGDGVDTVDYSASAARVRINLSTGAAVDADAAGDSLTAIENLIGTAFNDILTGSAVANALTGGAGNDQLSGLAGNDTMTGGAGADAFIFNAALDAATNIDTITDFSVINDVMWIENTFFTGLAAGALSAGAFQTGASATQADDRIIYNAATGALFFDADGNGAGAAVQFASLATGLALTNADFLVV